MAVAFSPELRARLKEIVARYPNAEAALIPVLHLAQAEHGWVSPDVMDAVATELGLPRAEVLATATFYTMFNKQPVGRHHIQVCSNISCLLRGADGLLELLKQRLGLEVGQTTADGRFTLSEVECLAACGTAPAIQVNDDYYENLDRDKLTRLLDELEAKP